MNIFQTKKENADKLKNDETRKKQCEELRKLILQKIQDIEKRIQNEHKEGKVV